jgi:hypothetical protein
VIYVDGQNDAAIFDHSVGHPVDPPVSHLLGRRRNGAGFFAGFPQGIMDEIMLFDRALSAAEIQSIFDAGSDGTCGAAVGGSVTGMIPNKVTCKNMTTGQP